MTVRLFVVLARRNAGLLLLPALVAICYRLAMDKLPVRVSLWPETSAAIRDTVILIGPLMGGLSAWVAGQDRWRGLEELLSTAPGSGTARALASWAATTIWGLLAYVTVAAYVMVLTFRSATWGGPLYWSIFMGLFAIAAYSALGYVVGYYTGSRFAAPLVAVVLFVVPLFITSDYTTTARYLSPLSGNLPSVFYGMYPDLDGAKSLWFLGVAATALAVVVVKRRRDTVSWGALAAAVAVAATGAAILLGTGAATSAYEATIAFKPVCAGKEFPVCVHPAYEKLLPEASTIVSSVASPLVGIPGAPTHAQQSPALNQKFEGGALNFDLSDGSQAGRYLGEGIARFLAREDESCGDAQGGDEPVPEYEAQNVLAAWLLGQAGMAPARDGSDPLLFYPETLTAEKHFSALDPQIRRTWLERNYADLRTCRVGLGDLP